MLKRPTGFELSFGFELRSQNDFFFLTHLDCFADLPKIVTLML